MRWVWLFIAFGANAFGAAAFGSTGLLACADIESAVERLDCYDRLAREAREAAVEAAVPARAESPPITQAREPDPPPAPPDPAEAGAEPVESRIVSVRKAPLGEQIVTLSNGQVWIENEPGRRRIAPDQAVVIRKRRLHYEMALDAQPDVAVRRLR